MNKHEFSNHIASLALKSVLYEVNTTPKPGLVDRLNSGAHKDMDIFTFMASSSVLFPYFYECSRAGLDFQGCKYRDLMKSLRPIGIRAEKQMFEATVGINTHKGIIFSMGIISAAAASLSREKMELNFLEKDLINRIKEMTQGLSHELKSPDKLNGLTYGEALYREYGLTGIRGEAESGFATVRKRALPILRKLILEGEEDINTILLHSLLYLMEDTQDSNVLGRHNPDTLKYMQERAGRAIELGGYLSQEGRKFVKEMDRDFIGKNISPGGAADLLAVSLYIHYLTGTRS